MKYENNVDCGHSSTLFIIISCFTATLKHVAKTVAHVDLSDHIISVVFTIFDENCEYIW